MQVPFQRNDRSVLRSDFFNPILTKIVIVNSIWFLRESLHYSTFSTSFLTYRPLFCWSSASLKQVCLVVKTTQAWHVASRWVPIRHHQMTFYSSFVVVVTWSFLSQTLQHKYEENWPSVKEPSTLVNVPSNINWKTSSTPSRGFWAMPHAVVVTSVASPSPTLWGCFVESAGIIGCGRSMMCKLLLFWINRINMRDQVISVKVSSGINL